ncbi:Nucleic acid-binding [Forsythia ovata]|uniref:Nucleic acid-binding n=1 Tax=Forsythia ovata TaxID=205694 RepID=A0ABD1VML4_9LAMI
MGEVSMVDLKDIINENIDKLFCIFKVTIVKVINKDKPWYDNCKTCNGRVYSRMDDDTTLCDKCKNKKASRVIKLILKPVVLDRIDESQVVLDRIDESHVTLFDASNYLIGYTLSEYA